MDGGKSARILSQNSCGFIFGSTSPWESLQPAALQNLEGKTLNTFISYLCNIPHSLQWMKACSSVAKKKEFKESVPWKSVENLRIQGSSPLLCSTNGCSATISPKGGKEEKIRLLF